MNHALAIRHVFGANAEVANNVWYAENDAVIYTAGTTIVSYSRIDRKQKHIVSPDGCQGITALAVSPNLRYAAAAERQERASISVYDLKTMRNRKHLQHTLSSSKQFVCLRFAADNQMLLALTAGPDSMLVCWNWSKARVVASIQIGTNVDVRSCSFCPTDGTVVCASGASLLRFYRLATSEFQAMPDTLARTQAFKGVQFLCHLWLQNPADTLIAGTSDGDLVLFSGGQYKCHLTTCPGRGRPVHCMALLDEGILVGTEGGTLISYTFHDRDEDSSVVISATMMMETATRVCDFAPAAIVSLNVNANGNYVVAATASGQLLQCPASGGFGDTTPIRYLSTAFHEPCPIYGADVCARKPLLVTCSKDGSVRMWNLMTSELEMCKQFQEELTVIAIHPSGLHIAVGFADRLRLFHILNDDLKPYREFPLKSCRECSFNSGGNYLAVSNGNSVAVFDFFSGHRIADLRGHNARVKDIFWTVSGDNVITCGQDGAVYVWDLEDSKRQGEFVHKGTMYLSAASVGNSVFAIGSDTMIKELELPELGVTREFEGGVALAHLAVTTAKNLMFVGAGEPGKPASVRAYVFPLTGEFTEYSCMGGTMTRLRLTANANYLVATDDNGCICVFDVKERVSSLYNNAFLDLGVPEEYSNDVLMTRTELEDRSNLEMELRTKVDELKMHNEYQTKIKEMNHTEKIKEVTDMYSQELEQAKTKFELLKEERNDMEIEYEEKLKRSEEKQQHDLRALESSFQSKLMTEVEKYQQLLVDQAALNTTLEQQQNQLQNTHQRYLAELEADYKQKLEENKAQRLRLEAERSDLNQEYDEIQQQLEDDVDQEIEQLRRNYEEKLATAREATLKYKAGNGIIRKKFSIITREIDDQKEEAKTLAGRENDLHDQIKMLEKELQIHKRDQKARDQAIAEKERKIYDLKKKNQELEKFKFVLDFKIKELKKQIEPRENQISSMKDRIKDMDAELERYHKINSQLDERIGDLRKELTDVQAGTKNKLMQARNLTAHLDRFKVALQACTHDIQDGSSLRERAQKLIQSFGGELVRRPIDPDVENEYIRQHSYLERTAATLKKQLQHEISNHRRENDELMATNMQLMKEIATQRDQNQQLKQGLQAKLGAAQQRERMRKKKAGLRQARQQDQAQINAFPVPDQLRAESQDLSMAVEKHRQYIARLRLMEEALQQRVTAHERAQARDVLPPVNHTVPMQSS